MQEFLHMGGHGFYVWSSFGITAVVMIANVLASIRQARRVREEIRARAEAQS